MTISIKDSSRSIDGSSIYMLGGIVLLLLTGPCFVMTGLHRFVGDGVADKLVISALIIAVLMVSAGLFRALRSTMSAIDNVNIKHALAIAEQRGAAHAHREMAPTIAILKAQAKLGQECYTILTSMAARITYESQHSKLSVYAGTYYKVVHTALDNKLIPDLTARAQKHKDGILDFAGDMHPNQRFIQLNEEHAIHWPV